MNRNIFFLLLALSFGIWQCGGDNASTNNEASTQENLPATAANASPVIQAQQSENILSASEIFEKSGGRYRKLHQTVVNNIDAINAQIDNSTSPRKLKDGLKASFQEVTKFDDIHAISQTSKYTSAETIDQFMSGLEMYLNKWGIE